MNHQELYTKHNVKEISYGQSYLKLTFKDVESLDNYLNDKLNNHDKSNSSLVNDDGLEVLYVDSLQDAAENLVVVDRQDVTLAIFDGDSLNHEMITVIKLSDWYQSILDDGREGTMDHVLVRTALVRFVCDMMM